MNGAAGQETLTFEQLKDAVQVRWVSLEDPAKEVLTKLVASRAQKRTDPAG